MRNTYILFSLLFLFTTLSIFNSCSKVENEPSKVEESNRISFDATAEKLAEVLFLANKNNWNKHLDYISKSIKSGNSMSADEKEEFNKRLGISYEDFKVLTMELHNTSNLYLQSLNNLSLSSEEKATIIRNDLSKNKVLINYKNNLGNMKANCFLRDACYVIGYFFAELIIDLTCTFFCEEEILPYLVMVQAFCSMFTC